MRVFIAIQLPEYVKLCARRVREQLRPSGADIKWVEDDNYHITLKFLGEVDQKEIVGISQELAKAAQEIKAFNLALSQPGAFPNFKQPRVLFLGLSGQLGPARELGQKIDGGLQGMGFKPDHRRHFHLTLGRFRSHRKLPDLLSILDNLSPIDNRPFPVREFYLMESRLSRKGPEYLILDRMKLAD
jgi:2'-5' RNA ligase